MDHSSVEPSGRIRAVGAAIIRSNMCLVAQRSEQMSFSLKWEFPGGKIEPDELPIDALSQGGGAY